MKEFDLTGNLETPEYANIEDGEQTPYKNLHPEAEKKEGVEQS